jgi:hypothetical protein
MIKPLQANAGFRRTLAVTISYLAHSLVLLVREWKSYSD